MSNKISWDEIADKFDTYKNDVWYGAADNIETVWPVVLNFIKEKYPNPAGQKSLDFGCGTGMFCQELKSLGFNPTGVDLSPEMIKIGQKNLDNSIKLYVGDAALAKSLAEKEGKFNLICSIMCLQFIEGQKLKDLAEALPEGGYFIFANHNPEHLTARGFTDTFTLSGTKTTVPIYKRTAEDYDNLFKGLGFNRLLETYPTESLEFLKKYNIERTSSLPKYMVLAYQLGRK